MRSEPLLNAVLRADFPMQPSLNDPEALRRFGRWLAHWLNPDASPKNFQPTCNSHMALPLYAHVTGNPELAAAALAFIESKFVRDGALIQPASRRNMMPYAPAWIVMGAALGGNPPLKTVLERYLSRFQDPRGGGFFGSESARDAGTGEIDFDSTTLACAALCSAGNAEAAEKCGRFLARLIESQAVPDRQFFFMWDPG